jgi:hypothetical protein
MAVKRSHCALPRQKLDADVLKSPLAPKPA